MDIGYKQNERICNRNIWVCHFTQESSSLYYIVLASSSSLASSLSILNVLENVRRETMDRIVEIIGIKIFIIICVLLQQNILKATKMLPKPTTVGKTSFPQEQLSKLMLKLLLMFIQLHSMSGSGI